MNSSTGSTAGAATRSRGERARSGQTVLEVTDLAVQFPTADGLVNAVNGVSYTVEAGRTLAIVGESGSGKSVSSMAVMGLHDMRRTRISGSILLDGQELVGASPATFRKLRSQTAAMIFQDPQSSFHPFKKVGAQLAEAYLAHHKVSKQVAAKRAVEMLDRVGIPNPQRRAKQYPHEFSGGMRQRAMIALGLINDPKLLIADEPTTALDVTVQAQILDLINDLQKEFGSAIILITHDLAVVAEVSDDVLVMYGGRGVEFGTTAEVLATPRHPYTWGLLGSVPSLTSDPNEPLRPVRGNPPSLLNLPKGCSFNPRCDFSSRVPGEKCFTVLPEFEPVPGEPGRLTRCHLTEPAEIFATEVAPKLGM
ncbi:ABC transporter ATP-binding protein [Yimella sp. cx-51]|uniref:ABC transporter ATP-binding protein n=1 Tax=Yimella sp. cx-51 TaxID=2770551 RepID=UPI00165D90B2|nr:ABC transporter ATP-binding protein [Yimella sp. cx-51]MBC9957529.1 ABC transporter ATP-binding protein [Yimella sp. cx-51]MBD2760770.1 ABC transporter ATP-binding protein [Yimella sp. cx-573]QTH39244.1 ABC transporter ATP-binding protein [Yimella sp. cx-51]